MAYDPSLGKTSEDFRFIFTDSEAIGKNKQKIRSHLGPVPQAPGERKALRSKAWNEETEFVYRLGRCTNMKKKLGKNILCRIMYTPKFNWLPF